MTLDAHSPFAPDDAAGADAFWSHRERLRLAALRSYDVLEAPERADLDGLVALAAHLAGTTSAAINLVAQDTVWQAAACGGERCELVRRDALCRVVVETGTALYLPDAQADPRWATTAYVDGRLARVRLYASVPLVTPGGHVVGTLCVTDEQPGRLTTEQLGALGLLADQVVRLFEAGRSRAVLEHALTEFDRVAHRDPLTGLANRAAALRALERVSTKGGWGLLFADVDDFKAANDLFGHEGGDRVLQEVARRLAGALRPHDLLVRWAGDEFVVLLADVHEDSEVQAAAARLERAVGAPFRLDGTPLTLSVSIGGHVVAAADDAEHALRQADLAMYEAKRRHKAQQQGAPGAVQVLDLVVCPEERVG